MKTILIKLCVLPLLLAGMVAPCQAQSNEAATASQPAPAAPAAPKAPVPNNNSSPNPKAKVRIPAPPQVRIDSHGIYVNDSDGTVEVNRAGDLAFSKMLIALAGIMTPFLCIGFVCWIFLLFRHRRNKMTHETLRAMIEKGVPIPPELITPPPPAVWQRTKSDLRSGLVLIALGLGLMVLLKVMDARTWPVGLIFLLMGGAFLLTWKLEKKNAANSEIVPK